MKIRFAVAGDMDRLLVLGELLHKESWSGRYPINMDKVKKGIEFYIKYPQQSCLLLAENETDGIVGIFAGYVTDLFFSDVRVAQNNTFYVLPKYRGSSAAIKLITAFRKWAENRGAYEMNIAMNSSINAEQFDRFFKKLHFVNTGANFSLPMKAPDGRVVKS